MEKGDDGAMICSKCKLNDVDPESEKTWCEECRIEARQAAQQWKHDHPKKKHDGRTYASRDFVLRELGFASYQEYLRSALWQRIRNKVFRVKGRVCQMCFGAASMVHHNRYHKNDLLGKNLAFLVPICGPCHERIEFSKKGRKLELHEAKLRQVNGARRLTNILCNFDAAL